MKLSLMQNMPSIASIYTNLNPAKKFFRISLMNFKAEKSKTS